MNLQTQWLTLVWMLASGTFMGIAFDSYRVVSGQLRFPRWSVNLLDLFYWIASALFVFRMLYHVNQGELRFYVFLGLFLGVWIHFLFLSVLTERFVVNLIRIVRRIYGFGVRLVYLTLVVPIKWLWKGFRLLLGFLWILIIFLGRVTLFPIWKLLAWAFRPILNALHIPDRLRKSREYVVKSWRHWRGKDQE